MDSSLVQLITELVMAELGRGAGSGPVPASTNGVSAGSATAPSRRRKLLLVPAPVGDSHGDPLWEVLAGLTDVSWTGIKVAGFNESRVRLPELRWIEPPLVWDELVVAHQGVVLPVLRLEILSRLAVLLGDVPASAAAIAAVMQGVPVYASALESDRLKRSSGRLPGPFLSLFHQHLRTVEGMGIQVLEAAALVQKLGSTRGAGASGPVGASARGRDVVTVVDVEAAARSGQKTLQVTPGTIVTPLARDRASQMQIEVLFS